MAKGLGQIHTVNWTLSDINDVSDYSPEGGNDTNIALLDLGSKLTDQLQTMVHTANIFKVVGIDMVLETDEGASGGGQISGRLEYYAPTRGRCLALKNAWDFQKDLLKSSGIPYGKNSNYDFKPIMYGGNSYSGITGGEVGGPTPVESDVPNIAYSPNSSGAPMTYCLARSDSSNQDIFGVWNDSLNPSGDVSDLFSSGFHTPDQTDNQDFVLFDEQLIYTPRDWADTSVQWIPFQLSWDPQDSSVSVSLEWRPDPALYLSVLTGQFSLFITEMDTDGDADTLTLRIAAHVAGWKSAISRPRRRKKMKSTSRKSSKRRRRK